MDIVYLHGIEVDCVIGVWDWEREITQRIRIDLEMGHDLSRAGDTDDLAHTLNYKEVSRQVADYCVERKAKLVEALAAGIAEILLETFQCEWCRVKINKTGAVRGAKDVGVIIERSRKPGG